MRDGNKKNGANVTISTVDYFLNIAKLCKYLISISSMKKFRNI